jgi:hypothetical protein
MVASARLAFVRPEDRTRLRFVAWACVIALLLAAALPVSAGLPQAILAPAGPILFARGAFSLLGGASETTPPDLAVLRGVAARAPPLA